MKDQKPQTISDYGGYVPSYYSATRNPAPLRPATTSDIDADICIVGGGYSGLSTAITLAEKGYDVTLLEAERIGWGASGRNGGQIVNGLNASLQKVKRQYGDETATFFASFLKEGNDLIRHRVQQYNISCDLKEKNAFAAFNTRHMCELEDRYRVWTSHGFEHLELLDKAGISDHVKSDVYVGGMVDHSGGHMHPLNLALGEAAALESLGGKIYEKTSVLSVDYSGRQPVIQTAQGSVKARHLVLCGNAYLGRTVKALTPRVLPVSTQMIATEPLGEERAHHLLPTDICIEDCRYILDYYRLSADKRLIFGGGSVYGGKDVGDVVQKLRPNMLKIFPSLTDVKIDYAWNGIFALSYSRVPQLGRLAPHTWFAHGYSGHGVTGSHLFGKILGEAIDGTLSRFDLLAKVPWLPFPGGRTFAAQYSAIGSWYYGVRDALGV